MLRSRQSQLARSSAHRLGHYPDGSGRIREIVCRAGHGGSVLVLDRDADGREHDLLVAHLGADEPAENAALVCQHYLSGGWRLRCRPLTDEDIRRAPFTREEDWLNTHAASWLSPALAGLSLRRLQTGMSIPELRWTRGGASDAISLREAIAAFESYEPLVGCTRRALADWRRDGHVSTVVLSAELGRVLESPIVLNRGLREAVLERTRPGLLSMSEIAMRCGRIKRDRKGNSSGETSWLARRIGLLAEGGHGVPTRWIHSDVLALIAREGLGIAPREVELG
ncbi:MAG TPA: hypothetical protein VGG08_06265 [Solirubrobacteraceae bacterium]